MKNVLLFFAVLLLGTFTQGQWFFETGINDSKFSEYTNLLGTKTTLHSYSGFRDFSYSVGYSFPFKSLNERAETNATAPILRLSLGLGFDQMNLRTLAQIGNTNTPLDYNFGQVQGQLNILFTPNIISINNDITGASRPIMNLLLEGGFSYNVYSSATRTHVADRGYIQDLKKDKEFVNAYPAYSFGGGLEFPVNRFTTIYGKYVVENAFSTDDRVSDSKAKETFSTVKQRVMVGLRLDLGLKIRLKDMREQRIAALEEAVGQKPEVVDLSDLYNKIEELNKIISEHKKQEDAHHDLVNKQERALPLFDVPIHEKGFRYLPNFKHVLFPLDSSHFNHEIYDSPLKNLATFIQQNPNLIFKLVGYADSKTGTKFTNLKLSERRAKRVYDYLLTLGVSPDRLSYVGAGETLQFSLGDLKENRRTEIIILEK